MAIAAAFFVLDLKFENEFTTAQIKSILQFFSLKFQTLQMRLGPNGPRPQLFLVLGLF